MGDETMAILSGRVWITGASSGIGAATAKMLAENRKWFYPRTDQLERLSQEIECRRSVHYQSVGRDRP